MYIIIHYYSLYYHVTIISITVQASILRLMFIDGNTNVILANHEIHEEYSKISINPVMCPRNAHSIRTCTSIFLKLYTFFQLYSSL